MFKCDGCNRLVGPGIARATQVVEIRNRVYPERTTRNSEGEILFHDRGGKGTEIVRERSVCPFCSGEMDADDLRKKFISDKKSIVPRSMIVVEHADSEKN